MTPPQRPKPRPVVMSTSIDGRHKILDGAVDTDRFLDSPLREAVRDWQDQPHPDQAGTQGPDCRARRFPILGHAWDGPTATLKDHGVRIETCRRCEGYRVMYLKPRPGRSRGARLA